MPTKWLQERAKGSKNKHGIGFEGPGVAPTLTLEHFCEDVSIPAYLERFRARREQLDILEDILPERSGQYLILTVLYMPNLVLTVLDLLASCVPYQVLEGRAATGARELLQRCLHPRLPRQGASRRTRSPT